MKYKEWIVYISFLLLILIVSISIYDSRRCSRNAILTKEKVILQFNLSMLENNCSLDNRNSDQRFCGYIGKRILIKKSILN